MVLGKLQQWSFPWSMTSKLPTMKCSSQQLFLRLQVGKRQGLVTVAFAVIRGFLLISLVIFLFQVFEILFVTIPRFVFDSRGHFIFCNDSSYSCFGHSEMLRNNFIAFSLKMSIHFFSEVPLNLAVKYHYLCAF